MLFMIGAIGARTFRRCHCFGTISEHAPISRGPGLRRRRSIYRIDRVVQFKISSLDVINNQVHSTLEQRWWSCLPFLTSSSRGRVTGHDGHQRFTDNNKPIHAEQANSPLLCPYFSTILLLYLSLRPLCLLQAANIALFWTTDGASLHICCRSSRDSCSCDSIS